MQNNRWSGVSALPYGPGWGTNPPGGVASCMTWDVTPTLTKWEPSSGNYARPRSVSAALPAGASRYLLEPSLNYGERPMFQDISADYPINVYSATQSNQNPQSYNDHLRHGPRGPSRAGSQVRFCDEDLEVLTPACSCSGRNQSRMGRNCDRCSCRRYQDSCRQSPKPPVTKFVQFAPENTGRVVEIVEDGHGRPVAMSIAQPNTPSQMMRNRRGYGTQRQMTKTFPHTMANIVDEIGCEPDECRNAVTNDVRRLMNIYQAGKADANFHKGVSEKWRSAVVTAGPNGREEVLTETQEKEKTVAVRRIQRVKYPTKQAFGNEADNHQIYCRNGYEPHGILTRSNGMTVMERQPCVAHGWKDSTDGRVRAWEADESSQPPNRVKLQIECPANVDTVVNVRVRPDAEYRFN